MSAPPQCSAIGRSAEPVEAYHRGRGSSVFARRRCQAAAGQGQAAPPAQVALAPVPGGGSTGTFAPIKVKTEAEHASLYDPPPHLHQHRPLQELGAEHLGVGGREQRLLDVIHLGQQVAPPGHVQFGQYLV